MPEVIDWDRLPVCVLHGGRRCLPSREFADLVAHLKPGLMTVPCMPTGSWPVGRPPERPNARHVVIPRPRRTV